MLFVNSVENCIKYYKSDLGNHNLLLEAAIIFLDKKFFKSSNKRLGLGSVVHNIQGREGLRVCKLIVFAEKGFFLLKIK
jgi:hypothetical protein